MKRILSLFSLICFGVSPIAAQPHLPKYFVTELDTSSKGYYIFTILPTGKQAAKTGACDLIIDAKGNPVYLKEFESGFSAGNLQLHNNGRYSYFFDKKFFIVDSLFRAVDTVFCQNGVFQDPHELLILANGNYALLGYENSTMNLSKYFIFKKSGAQGLERALVRSGVIQELSPKKEVLFEWHAKQHYLFDDMDTLYIDNLYDIDWTHFNGLEYDKDGNYLVSVEHFNEVTKIDRSTGKIMWRLGGRRNQFAFLNDSLKFKGPHHVRRLPNRYVTIFDNGFKYERRHPETAKEYRLDERNLSVTLIWSHVNNKNLSSSEGGSVQRLANRNTLISYGFHPQSPVLFNVINQKNRKCFEIQSNDSLCIVKAANYVNLPGSLPQPRINIKSTGVSVILEAEPGHKNYYWSTGETTRSISVKKDGSYFVAVSFGPDAYLYSKPCDVNHFSKTKPK